MSAGQHWDGENNRKIFRNISQVHCAETLKWIDYKIEIENFYFFNYNGFQNGKILPTFFFLVVCYWFYSLYMLAFVQTKYVGLSNVSISVPLGYSVPENVLKS